MIKALPIDVYKPSHGDCSNGGISSRFSSLLLVCDEGFVDVDESNPPENLVKMVTRDLGFTIYSHIEPYVKPNGVGWMAGGCVAYSPDSRFTRMSQYPLSLHDRQEGWQEYYSHD